MNNPENHLTMRTMYSLFTLLGILLISPAFADISGDNSANEKGDFTKAPYPRIAMLWNWVRGEEAPESIARHDLIMIGQGALGLQLNKKPYGLADGFTPESIEKTKKYVNQLRQLNPDAVIIADMLFYEYYDEWLPEDHEWWLRKNGERQQFWPGTHRMDWNNPDYRKSVIKRTASLMKCGVDGVFYDNIRNEPEPWVAFLSELRETIGDDFLILANAGYDVGSYNFVCPFINGIMYESGWSHNRTEWDDCIQKMQHTQTLLREPRISLIERFEEVRDQAGWPGDPKKGQKPEPDPAARHWSLCYALTIGDFYYLFSDNTSHRHDWYPEYDIKIGLPVEEGKRINSHVWTRKYEKALVVVNLPGAKEDYIVELKQARRDSFTGKRGTRFVILPGDGRILVLD
jgi:hypothetical protein